MKVEVYEWTTIEVKGEFSSGSISLRFTKDGLSASSSCGAFAQPELTEALPALVRAVWELAYDAGKAASK